MQTKEWHNRLTKSPYEQTTSPDTIKPIEKSINAFPESKSYKNIENKFENHAENGRMAIHETAPEQEPLTSDGNFLFGKILRTERYTYQIQYQ